MELRVIVNVIENASKNAIANMCANVNVKVSFDLRTMAFNIVDSALQSKPQAQEGMHESSDYQPKASP